MKKLIRSSTEVKAARSSDYDDHIFYERNNQEFSVYTKFADDPDNFQCQISEVHPYDLAEYTSATKDSPVGVTFYRNGRRVGQMRVPEYFEDDYEDATEYVNEVIDRICVELMHRNADVEPRIDHT